MFIRSFNYSFTYLFLDQVELESVYKPKGEHQKEGQKLWENKSYLIEKGARADGMQHTDGSTGQRRDSSPLGLEEREAGQIWMERIDAVCA